MPDYFESGFSVREPMWHGKGRVADEYPENWKQAREWAGLMWEPEVVPLYKRVVVAAGAAWPAGAIPEHYRVEGVPAVGQVMEYSTPAFVESEVARSITRNDTGLELGRCGMTYEPMLNEWIGEILEALTTADGAARFLTAGAANEGRQVWALVQLNEPVYVAGDDTATYPFIALLNSNDGTGAVKAIYTMVRVVCWNTYQMASFEADRTGHQFIFRHVGDMRVQVEEAKQALDGLRSSFGEWVQLAEALAKVDMGKAELTEFSTLLIPAPAGKLITDRQQANVDKARAQFMHLATSSITTDGHRGNALGALDAAVEYLDHVRRASTADILMTRTLLKPNAAKRAALGLLDEVCGLGLNINGIDSRELAEAVAAN